MAKLAIGVCVVRVRVARVGGSRVMVAKKKKEDKD